MYLSISLDSIDSMLDEISLIIVLLFQCSKVVKSLAAVMIMKFDDCDICL